MTGADRRVDIVSIGEAMIEFNQVRPGAPEFLQGFGGDTSNAIIAAARQGARTAYVTRLGADAFGDRLMDLWRSEGVATDAVSRDPQAPTAVYFVTHGAEGHAFSYLRAGSAASRMTPADLPAALIRGARFLHCSGISQAISASACDTVFAAIATARAAGVKVAYDSNLRIKLWPLARARAIIKETVAHCDLFLPSLEDAELFRATLNKSPAGRASMIRAVCGVANPRHSWAMAAVCALQPIPNQGAHPRGDLFSVALAASAAATRSSTGASTPAPRSSCSSSAATARSSARRNAEPMCRGASSTRSTRPAPATASPVRCSRAWRPVTRCWRR